MRYIGSKTNLIDFINNAITENLPGIDSVFDIFSGTGIVAESFKNNGYITSSNDFLYFSYVLQKTHIGLETEPTFDSLDVEPIAFLNDIKWDGHNDERYFIYNNYAPNDENNRMYFQPDNAIKIDLIRLQIEEWKKDNVITDEEYLYLIASLVEAVPYVANITGVYAAYLKYWDKRTYKQLELQKPNVIPGKVGQCFNNNYLDVIDTKCDLLYADPPYNAREYLPNYHILETIARYDYPEIHGVSGMRKYDEQKSPFCKKKQVHTAFEDLIDKTPARYVLISYNNEGLLSQEELTNICVSRAKANTFRLIERDYRRYKSKIKNDTNGLKEQLYLLEKK